MAKLKGVEVVDMVDGVPTKIKYNGKTYEKYGEDNRREQVAGDIVLNKTNKMDADAGNYYVVKKRAGGRRNIVKDDSGDTHSEIQFDCHAYKMTDEVTTSLSDRVDVLEERVSTLESSEDKPKLKTVKRAAKKGEKIVITDISLFRTMRDMTVGKTYDVVGEGLNGDRYVNIRDDKGDPASAYKGGYEVVIGESPEPRRTIQVGDKVRVVTGGRRPQYSWGRISEGDVGVVKRVDDKIISVDFPKQDNWSAAHGELEIVEEGDGEINVGDKVRLISGGGGMCLLGFSNGDECVVLNKHYDGSYRIENDGAIGFAERKQLSLIESAPTPETSVKVGGVYTVNGPTRYGDIAEGTDVKVKSEVNPDTRSVRIELLDGSDYDFIKPEYLTEVKPSEGDIVRIKESTDGHVVGTIGEVTSIDRDGDAHVKAMYRGGEAIFIEEHVEVIGRKGQRIDV